MKQYRTLKTFKVSTGLIGLSAGQAKDRAAKVEPRGDGVYEVLQQVQFKAGEIVGLAEVGKAMQSVVELVSSEEPAEVAADPASKSKSKSKPARA